MKNLLVVLKTYDKFHDRVKILRLKGERFSLSNWSEVHLHLCQKHQVNLAPLNWSGWWHELLIISTTVTVASVASPAAQPLAGNQIWLTLTMKVMNFLNQIESKANKNKTWKRKFPNLFNLLIVFDLSSMSFWNCALLWFIRLD